MTNNVASKGWIGHLLAAVPITRPDRAPEPGSNVVPLTPTINVDSELARLDDLGVEFEALERERVDIENAAAAAQLKAGKLLTDNSEKLRVLAERMNDCVARIDGVLKPRGLMLMTTGGETARIEP